LLDLACVLFTKQNINKEEIKQDEKTAIWRKSRWSWSRDQNTSRKAYICVGHWTCI